MVCSSYVTSSRTHIYIQGYICHAYARTSLEGLLIAGGKLAEGVPRVGTVLLQLENLWEHGVGRMRVSRG